MVRLPVTYDFSRIRAGDPWIGKKSQMAEKSASSGKTGGKSGEPGNARKVPSTVIEPLRAT